MRAIRLIRPGQPLALQEVAVPAIGADDVLVRVKAAGICRSDVHYRAGVSPVRPLPLTLGHEVAGVVAQAGRSVSGLRAGDRVCLHYLISCGRCGHCLAGREQFCLAGSMIGKYRDGGYADFIAVPARNALRLPEEITFEQGAVLMCSSATAFHALERAAVRPGERVAVFGVGGLGMSAVQLARARGAAEVYAVDVAPAKLRTAEALGAIPVDNTRGRAGDEIRRLTAGAGVEAALELIGLPVTVRQALDALAVGGRLVVVGLGDAPLAVNPYLDLISKEASVIGCNDHLAAELPPLLDLARRGTLDLSGVVTRRVPLEAGAVNDALDRLQAFDPNTVRAVIVPPG